MARRTRWMLGLLRVGALCATALLTSVALQLAVHRVVPVVSTSLMGVRVVQGEGLQQRWVALESLPAYVPAAVMAAEDQRFCAHRGVDTVQVEAAWRQWREDGSLRGASTLSMQTTKNVLLWPGRDVLRKALELPLTGALELAWGKRRIIEVYLNIAEWGPGIYGIEAAAHHHFGVPARSLSRGQAALLAAVLPAPRTRSPSTPSRATRRRARDIERAIGSFDTTCVEPG